MTVFDADVMPSDAEWDEIIAASEAHELVRRPLVGTRAATAAMIKICESLGVGRLAVTVRPDEELSRGFTRTRFRVEVMADNGVQRVRLSLSVRGGHGFRGDRCGFVSLGELKAARKALRANARAAKAEQADRAARELAKADRRRDYTPRTIRKRFDVSPDLEVSAAFVERADDGGWVLSKRDRIVEDSGSFKLGAATVIVGDIPSFDDSQIVATDVTETPALWGETERLVKRVEEPLTLMDADGRTYTVGAIGNDRCELEVWG